MNIIETNLSFGNMDKRASTTRIIVHHAAASNCSVEDVHRWHKANGWAGIGYHFFVRKNGEVYRGRPIDKVGSHAYGSNFDSIGICAEGNYSSETQPDAQVKAIQELIAYIKGMYNIQKIQKHSDVCSTDCPSRNYRFNEIVNGEYIESTKQNIPYPNMFTKKGDKGDRVKQIQQQLILKGYSIGVWGADGNFGNATDDGIRRFQKNNGLAVDGIVGKNTWARLFN